MKVGLTGSIGTGKTTVSNILINRGIRVIDADKISRKITDDTEYLREIVDCFGEKILDNKGKLDRGYLRNLIFSNDIYKMKLEDIMHPLINQRIWEEYLIYKDEAIVVFDIPLLFEAGYDKYMDIIIVVACDYDVQMKRIMKRDNTTVEKAKLILESQIKQSEKISRADYVIFNNGSILDLEKEVDNILEIVFRLK
ncbi:MAG: dephospho-CoA kinase [Filifactoraceae bacterium]